VSTEWETCDHEWITAPGDRDLGDVPGAGPREEVICSKCSCPGERYIETGRVEWPTT